MFPKILTFHSWEKIYWKFICLIEIKVSWSRKESDKPQFQNPKYTVFFRKRKILFYKSLLVIGQKEQTFPQKEGKLMYVYNHIHKKLSWCWGECSFIHVSFWNSYCIVYIVCLQYIFCYVCHLLFWFAAAKLTRILSNCRTLHCPASFTVYKQTHLFFLRAD